MEIRQAKGGIPKSEQRIARADPHRFGHVALSLLRASKKDLNPPGPHVYVWQAAIQADGELDFAQRQFWCAQGHQHKSALKVCPGAVWRQLQRFGYCSLGQTNLLGTRIGHVGVDFPHVGFDQTHERVNVRVVGAERFLKDATCFACSAN